jgi:hypothetical protein
LNSNIYHITNGDALTERLQGLQLEGFLFTMRECMIDGPVEGSGDWATFFSSREVFIYEQFGRELSYEGYVLSQLKKMKSIPEGSTIYFWFEDDLFCQANWWFLLYYLRNLQVAKYLVRVGDDSPYSFAGLSNKELLEAPNYKIELEERALKQLWDCYSNNNLDAFYKINKELKSKYPFIEKAFNAHMDRQENEGLLGKPKEMLLELLEKYGKNDFRSVFKEFSRQLLIYGYGDLQVQNMIKELKS